jgi:hypothetical protein
VREGEEGGEEPHRHDGNSAASAGALASNPLPWREKRGCSSAIGEIEMIADPKSKSRQDEGDSDKRRREEEALDEALKNTFPASDPVSVEQPTTTGRARRS